MAGTRLPRTPSRPRAGDAPPRSAVAFTNLDKVFWPGAGFTKGDLVDYYEAIAPWLLP